MDVAVCGDNLDPDKMHQHKVDKYAAIEAVQTEMAHLSGHRNLVFSAFAVNWRGVVSGRSASDLLSFGIRRTDIKLLSLVTVEQGTVIHRCFQTNTYRRPGWNARQPRLRPIPTNS